MSCCSSINPRELVFLLQRCHRLRINESRWRVGEQPAQPQCELLGSRERAVRRCTADALRQRPNTRCRALLARFAALDPDPILLAGRRGVPVGRKSCLLAVLCAMSSFGARLSATMTPAHFGSRMAAMARGSITVFLVLVAALGAGSLRATAAAAAQPLASAERADPVRPLGWLKAGNSAALDEYYSHQQQDYEAGRISDERLYASFHKLCGDSLDDEASYDRWVQTFPNSYAAVLARGIYFYRMAWEVRGNKYLTETSAQQIEAMKNRLARARSELLASLKLTSKPYLSTLYLLDAAMIQGSAEERRRWYEDAMAIDPSNVLIPYRYMFSLRPRWGGSYRQMEEFLAQEQAQQAPPALLAKLAMLIHADQAEDAMQAGDNQKIFDEW